MSDFFGEYFAPGAFMTGAGITGYRAAKELYEQRKIGSAWRAQKDAQDFFASFQKSRGNRFVMHPDDLIDAMYFDTGRYKKLQGAALPPEAIPAFNFARGRSVSSLITSYGLETKAAALGITDPANITRLQLKTLLNASPAHVRHLERAAAANSMLGLLNMPTADAQTLDVMQHSAKEGLESMISARRKFIKTGGRTIGDMIEGDRLLRSKLSPSNFMAKPVNVLNPKTLEKALQAAGRGDLVSSTHELFEQVRGTKGNVKMQLLYMDSAQGQFLSGVRIAGNKAISPVDIPIVQSNGEVRLGHYGQERMLARNVPANDLHNWVQSGTGDVNRKLDVALTEHLTQNFSKYTATPGGWSTMMNDLRGSYREDVGRAIMPITSNVALNRKVTMQTTFRELPFGPKNIPLSQIDAAFRDRHIDTISGLSPTQQESGIRILRKKHERVLGVESVGSGTGDDKTLAQKSRPKVVTSKNRARAVLEGIQARAMQDTHAQIRSYAMPEEAMRGMLANSSRFDIGIHEDIAILLDKNITYKDMKTVRIHSGSGVSSHMQQLMESEWYRPFRDAATSRVGVTGTLEDLERKIQDAGVNSKQGQLLSRRAELIRQGQIVAQSEILGELPQGGYAKGSKEGQFFIDRMEYISKMGQERFDSGELVLRGEQVRNLGVGDKTFGWKRVFTGEMNRKEGLYMASLFEATKDAPEVRAALAMEDKAAGSAMLQSFYADDMKRFRDHMDKTNWDGSLAKLAPAGIKQEAWATTIDRFSDIQALDVQGTKRIGGRTMDFAVHSMISDLANERVRLEDSVSGLDEVLQHETNPLLADDSLDEAGRIHAKRLARLEKPYLIDKDTVDFDAIRRDREYMRARIEALNDSMGRLGLVGHKGNAFLFDDAAHDPSGSKNLVNLLDQTLEETMEETSAHGMHKWSTKRLFEDLALAQDLTTEHGIKKNMMYGWAANSSEEDRTRIYRHMMQDKTMRAEALGGLQKQLQFGMQTRSYAIGGNPKFTTGSGGPGSFNLSMMQHMRTQGGVMSELGMEFAGRLTGDKADEAAEVYRRAGAFYKGVGENTPVVNLAKLAQDTTIDSTITDSLFSRNQFARDEAFAEIRNKFNLPESDSLIFDLGEGAENRHIYHPQQISSHTGGFMTPSGVATTSGIDASLKDIIHGYKRQDLESITEGVSRYEAELAKITLGKKQAPTSMFSGKIQGSMRAQAVPQKSDALFKMAGLDPSDFSGAVGVRENQFRRMLSDIGSVDQYDERLQALRAGKEAAVIARQPGTELHRISSVRMFSIDEVFKKAAENKTLGMDDNAIAKEIMAINKEQYYKNQRQFKKDLGTIQDTNAWWRDKYNEALKSTYGDNAIFLPKHMEMILGADYDDDQLDVILARDKNLNKSLRERAIFHSDLLQMNATPEEATKLARNAVEGRAAEDYIYKYYQRDLYAGLKTRAGAEPLTKEALTVGTQEWKETMRAQGLMAEFEKGYIGRMTNSTDFVREVLRTTSHKDTGMGRLYTEMLLGIMPETALKARQHGPAALLNPEFGLEKGIKDLNYILSGEVRRSGMTRKEQIVMFNEAFTSVHGQSRLATEMLKFTPNVIDAVSAGSRKANLITKYLKRSPDEMKLNDVLKMLEDPSIPSRQGAAYRAAVEGIGTPIGEGGFSRHIKNTGVAFNEVFDAIKRHKNPALIGTGIAVASAMMLGSPGSISEDEANAAGARSQHSQPTTPPPDFQDVAPVSTGSGKAVRVRGTTDGRLDMAALSAAIQGKYPGADVSYTMNDFRERMNEEYLRKRLNR